MRFINCFILIILTINTGFQYPSNGNDEISDFLFTLETGETKRWKSSDTPSEYSGYADIYSEGAQQFLVLENRLNTAVEFYPWESDSLSFAVRADSAELKEEFYMQGFYVASCDSVFILDASNGKLHLLNKKGSLLNTHTMTSGSADYSRLEEAMAGIYSGSPGIRQGEWLHMASAPFSGSSDPSTFTKGKTNVAINLATGETRYGYGYPELYKSGEYAQYYKDIKRCPTPDGRYLFSFGPEDSVRLTDLKKQEKAFFAGSSFFATPPPAVPELGNTAKPQSYGGILYDKKNQVYYRMALHGVPDILQAEYGFDDQEISIIILDKDFKKIGETMLPKGQHNFRQWFVGPEGLYISNHHPGRLSANKNEVSFTNYKLTPTKKEQ